MKLNTREILEMRRWVFVLGRVEGEGLIEKAGVEPRLAGDEGVGQAAYVGEEYSRPRTALEHSWNAHGLAGRPVPPEWSEQWEAGQDGRGHGEAPRVIQTDHGWAFCFRCE